MCRVTRVYEQRRELDALSKPKSALFEDELEAYVRNTVDEVQRIACRSAFRYNKHDHLCGPPWHLLRIYLNYDAKPRNLRKRFTLIGAGIKSCAEILNSKEPIDVALQVTLSQILQTRTRRIDPKDGREMMTVFVAQDLHSTLCSSHCESSSIPLPSAESNSFVRRSPFLALSPNPQSFPTAASSSPTYQTS